MTLSQKAYIDGISSCFHLENAKPLFTPMEVGTQLSQATRAEGDMIGALMYAVTATRPDIMFAMSTLAQHLQNPTQIHWEVAKRVV